MESCSFNLFFISMLLSAEWLKPKERRVRGQLTMWKRLSWNEQVVQYFYMEETRHLLVQKACILPTTTPCVFLVPLPRLWRFVAIVHDVIHRNFKSTGHFF